jgi:hypothetical protein
MPHGAGLARHSASRPVWVLRRRFVMSARSASSFAECRLHVVESSRFVRANLDLCYGGSCEGADRGEALVQVGPVRVEQSRPRNTGLSRSEMAAKCPCGCGGPIGWLKRGASDGYRSVLLPTSQLREIVAVAGPGRNEVRDLALALADGGTEILVLLERHLHSSAPLSVEPNLTAVNRLRLAWLREVQRFDDAIGRAVRGQR